MKRDVAGVTARPDGRHSRWDEHRRRRRAELIEATLVAISRHGENVGVDAIARTAGTSKPVLYRYFADKEDLYRAVTTEAVGVVLATLRSVGADDGPPRDIVASCVAAYLHLIEANPEIFLFVSHHPTIVLDSGERTDFQTVVAGLIGERLAAHLAAAGRPAALAHPWSEGIVGFTHAASLWWITHRDAMTRDELAEYLTTLLWTGATGFAPGVDARAWTGYPGKGRTKPSRS